MLKRNPVRAEEICLIRNLKKAKTEKLYSLKNEYLKTYKKAKPETARKKIQSNINKLKIDGWLNVVQSFDNAQILELNKIMKTIAENFQL